MRHPGLHTAVLAALSLAIVGTADATVGIRSDCQPSIGHAAQISDPLTASWYQRFWTGSCGGLSGCVAGSPNWNDVVGKLVARSPLAQRDQVLARACRLGPLIGLEWTRPRAVRRIDTGDLRGFQRTLESSPDVLSGIEAVMARVRIKLEPSA